MTERTEQALGRIENLAAQARIYSEGMAMNLLQLGRVLTEAKALVPHGEWKGWIAANAGMGERTAQACMQTWRRFGDKPQFAGIERSKLFKLLALPEGQEEAFEEEHDLKAMTAREVEQAVKAARDEARAEIDRVKAEAEARIRELADREPEIPEDLLTELREGREALKDARQDAQHFAELARQAGNEKAAAERRSRALQAELDEQSGILVEQQQVIAETQEQLLSLQSAQARGDGMRMDADELTVDVFAAAVREFIGNCARLPYMGATFAGMDTITRARYMELLKTVEGWCEQSRAAMSQVSVDGGIEAWMS